jgi:anti-sigma regulatory factor (Ser/Thr protein kinase)
MKLKKNSLFFRILFYNNLSVIITAILISAFFLGYNYYNDTIKFYQRTEERTKYLEKVISEELNEINDIVYTNTIEFISKQESFNPSMMNEIREKILKEEKIVFQESIISVLDVNANLLYETGDEKILKEASLIKNLEKAKKYLTVKSEYKTLFYMKRIQDKNYIRLVFSILDDKETVFIVTTLPLDEKFMRTVKSRIFVNKEDKIFLFVDGEYVGGDLDTEEKSIVFNKIQDKKSMTNLRKLKMKNYWIEYFKMNKTSKDNNIIVGLAAYKINYFVERRNGIVLVGLITILVAIFITILFKKFLLKLVSPLINIVDIAEKYSINGYQEKKIGDYKEILEVHQITQALKKMFLQIEKNNKKILKQEEKRKETALRVELLTRLVIEYSMEEKTILNITKILKELTSNNILGYSRGMYFKYIEKENELRNELIIYNEGLLTEFKNESNNILQIPLEELNKISKNIIVSLSNENLFTQSLKNRKIKYFNEKGYKYNLGNDLFKVIGIENFLIVPLCTKNKYYGCIVLDYFCREKEIDFEEYKLMELFVVNLCTKLEEKDFIENRLNEERNNTVEHLVTRFMENREEVLVRFSKIIEKYRKDKNALLTEELDTLEKLFLKIKKSNNFFEEYTAVSKETFDYFEIEEFFDEIMGEEKRVAEERKINLSIFINTSVKIYGNKENLKKAIVELLKNAYESFENYDEKNRAIKIIVSKEKNRDKIKISIVDNGKGIKEEYLKNIYKPFYKFVTDETNLGLALVFRILKNHVGTINFESKYNEGTKVTILLDINEGGNRNVR